MNEAIKEGMAEPFGPGNLVRLRTPYKPDEPVGPWRQEHRAAWRAWPGFTHGIVVETLHRDREGWAARVSLHLYDPKQHLLYCHGSTVPVYVDFAVQELEPHKIAADPGYGTLPPLDE